MIPLVSSSRSSRGVPIFKRLEIAGRGTSWGLVAETPRLQGAGVWSLVRELDPTCHSRRSRLLQGTLKIPRAATNTQQINFL